MSINILIIIIVIIAGISLKAFGDSALMNKLMYVPYLCKNDKQYYRAFTHILIHGDMGHLIFEQFPQYNFEDFLMVGDSDVDLTFARKLGIKCIIVKF